MTMTQQEVDRRWQEILSDGGSNFPPQDKEYGDGNGGRFPKWATHMIAFLMGSITISVLLFTPIFFPAIMLVGVAGLAWVAVKKRWR